MRRLLLLSLVLAAALYLAAAVELGASVRSGPIVISSMDDIYVFVAPDDGNVKLFKLRDLDSTVAYPVWSYNITGVFGGIPSTGGHAYHSASKTNFVFIAPKGKGLYGFYFSYTPTATRGALNGGNALFDSWDKMLGGIAVVTASQTADMATVIVIGLDEEGYLRAATIALNDNDSDNVLENVAGTGSIYTKVNDGGAFSTLAVDGFNGPADNGSLTIYLGTDENVQIIGLGWYATGGGNLVVESSKTIAISGVAQSGFAIGESYVYFLSYGLDKAYFHVLSKDGSTHREFPIYVGDGEALAGYPTNSPVVEETLDGEENVYFAVGKAVYKFNPAVDAAPVKYDDIGELIYTAPVIVRAKDGSNNLIVVSKSGRVYKVIYQSHEEIPSSCAGLGEAYAPPIVRGGRLIYAVDDSDDGYLCSVNVSNVGDGVPIDGWPAFGFADGRTQIKGENPPFKISNYMLAFLMDNTSLDGIGIEGTYVADSNPATDFTFNDIISVDRNASLTVWASDLYLGTWDKIPGTNVVWYDFDHWVINGDATTNNPATISTVTGVSVWKAYYRKKFPVVIEYINMKSTSTVLSTDSTWIEAGANYTLTPPSSYSHVKWVVEVQGSDPVEVADERYTITVSSPVYVKEYVNLVFGYMHFMYPYIAEDGFRVFLRVTKMATIINGITVSSSINSFFVKLDLTDLGIPAEIVDATFNLNLENATPETEKAVSNWEMNGPVFEYVVTLATPIEEATNVFVATLTVRATSDSYFSLADLMKRDMVDSGIGNEENKIGIFKVLMSGEKLEGEALTVAASFAPEDLDSSSRLKYFPEYITPCLGDFNMDGRVDGWDMLALMDHYGLKEGDPDWDPLYDIAPRNGFNSTTDVGWLIPESPRKIDFQDIVIEAIMYGATCTTE